MAGVMPAIHVFLVFQHVSEPSLHDHYVCAKRRSAPSLWEQIENRIGNSRGISQLG
jgi:hypothetical protein